MLRCYLVAALLLTLNIMAVTSWFTTTTALLGLQPPSFSSDRVGRVTRLFDAINTVAGGDGSEPGTMASSFRGCSMKALGPTEYEVSIDGDEADLGG